MKLISVVVFYGYKVVIVLYLFEKFFFMKTILLNSSLGILAYLISGVLLYGYHSLVLPLFLLIIGVLGYVLLRNQDKNRVTKGLFWLYAPVLLLLLITGWANHNFLVVLLYLVFASIMALLTRLAISTSKKMLFYAGVLLIVVGAFFAFQFFLGQDNSFEIDHIKTFYQGLSG
ncbi:hypothetical protein DKB58_04420 [Capnocytophaga canimorsus]|nr:hypothetical protein DKB58_04420 [Capnocytophaga canimorsus]AYW36874.1 hypothetical protein D8L92_05870 [Capnocytophaga canimorsus]